MGHPSIYPTGTTLYQADRAWSGYTIFPSAKGALLIDMRGNEVQLWAGLDGFPNKILPGGFVLGSSGSREPRKGFQDQLDLLQVDWDGNIVWKFDRNEQVEDEPGSPRFIARQHHDFQRDGSSTGYYAPGSIPRTDGGNTLILVHTNVENHGISDKPLLDDRFIEVDWQGNIVWDWLPSDHFDELGFDEAAKNLLFRDPSMVTSGRGDWLHINSLSTLGPNRWYDGGDGRFHPDNLIWDARNANILAITDKKTGKIVWRIGPDFGQSEALDLEGLGWIIGQHHLHMIPHGLPGEGNLLVFDNGGWGGYGPPSATSLYGINDKRRDYSRVIEFNPVTREIEWEYTAEKAGLSDNYRFYSPYISSAQRLPNGNTLITEGSDGRLFEVTPSCETVWEYVNPYYSRKLGGITNMVYRAYRVPYDWIPQLDRPHEAALSPPTYLSLGYPPSAPPAGSSLASDPKGAFFMSALGDPPTGTVNFDADVLASSVPVLLYFWAMRCKHCTAVSPIIDQLEKGYAGRLKIVRLNVEEEKDLVESLQVMATPTLILYKDGKPAGRKNSAVSKHEIEAMLSIGNKG
ncbi:MAG: aryl-sulfate sulfotransferase [Spirochaetaceae bacterium]|jgi:thiol-disulfide isomerase/thioredoxin|nr:aryl-sulfate sulfotransferase [Spirochaetaceae bacterium]